MAVRVVDPIAADDVIESLSHEISRALFDTLHDELATASAVAEFVDTTVQKLKHHIETRPDADLVGVVNTRYSVNGREIIVSVSADGCFVACVGDEHDSVSSSLTELTAPVAIRILTLKSRLNRSGADRYAVRDKIEPV